MSEFITYFVLFILVATCPSEVLAQEVETLRKDTLCIATSGSNNQVLINAKKATPLNGCTDSLDVKGQILQRGQNNSVEINTKRETPNNKLQITNNDQKSNNKNTVIIRQNGKNNSVKINTR